MAKIIKTASAGTMESSDAFVTIEPAEANQISIESAVEAQFGESIRKSAEEVMGEYQVSGARLVIKDQGALDCVIRARVETAIRRGMEA